MKSLFPILLLGTVLLLPTLLRAKEEKRPLWGLEDGPTWRDNGLRGEVVLNGLWKAIQPEDKVVETFVPLNTVLTTQREAEPGQRRPRPDPVMQTLWREITIPEVWKDRRVVVEIGGLSAPGELLIDGKKIADLPQRKQFLEYELPAGIANGQPHRLEVRTAGIIGDDVWLRSYPPGEAPAAINDSFLMTSWRERNATIRLAGSSKAGDSVVARIAISEEPGGKPVMTWTAETKAGPDGRWSLEASEPWAGGIRPWSREEPNLYFYTVELRQGDRLVDAILPRRFGFREVWIEDGQFVVNGIQTNFYSDSWFNYVPTRGVANASRMHAERVIKNHAAHGIRYAGGMLRVDTIREVADEVGLVGFVPAGSMVRLNIWDPRNGFTTMTGEEQLDDIERMVKRVRESPSVLFYSSNSGYSQASMHPQWAGRKSETWNFFPLNRSIDESRQAQMIFKTAQDNIRNWDPTRVVASHNGLFTDVDMTTRYLCNNLDRQEMADFVEDWAKSERKNAIVSSEVHVPFTGEFFLREIDFVLPQSKGIRPKLYSEMGARYYGEEAYKTPEPELRQWAKTNSYESRNNAVFQKTTSDNIRDIFRVWRAYGVNVATHHIQSEDGFPPLQGDRKNSASRYEKPVLDDPRVPGVAEIKGSWWWLPGEDPIWPVGETYFATFAPRIMFLAGPDGPSDKTHMYFVGDEVRKFAIFVNDRDKPVELSGEWTLKSSDGKAITQGKLAHSVPAGERSLEDMAISFHAPDVKDRSEFELSVRLSSKGDPTETYSEAMSITVFPRRQAKPPKFAGQVWMLNISDDRTHETPHFHINLENEDLLRRSGLEPRLIKGLRKFEFIDVSLDGARAIDTTRELVTEGTPSPGDLLIIPRHTLSTGHDERQLNLRLLREMNLDRLIADGLRVLVLEQDLPNLLGINTENVRPRHAFIAANGHPVFKGLENSDLSNWSGHSDLQTAMTGIAPTENRFPERVWQTSNRNSVATRTLIRPQTGATRALAVSGFDLQESPLLEATIGKGRIVFCQFDITNRYGKDPAATHLFDNILAYIMTAPAPNPDKSEIRTVAPDASGVRIVDNPLNFEKPPGEAGWGITAGELFVRESIYKDHWKANPDRRIPVFAGKENEFPFVRSNDGWLETTLTPDLMETEWGKRKMAWVRSALVVNQGGSRSDGPALAHHGDILELYPHAWVENFVHPYTSNIW